MDEFERKPPETHPIIDAMSVVATYRTHLDRALLDHAESYLEDVEPDEEDRRVLLEVRANIDSVLETVNHDEIVLERVKRASAPTIRREGAMSHEELLRAEGYDEAMREIRATLESGTGAVAVMKSNERHGLYEFPEDAIPESTR